MSRCRADEGAMTGMLQAEARNDTTFEMCTVKVGSRVVDVAVADTPARWRQGMAGQNTVDYMLFVMPERSTFPFHMDHVDRDLGIACFDAAGRVVDVGLMEAHTGFFQPRHPYRNVLEWVIDLPDFSFFGDLADGLNLETGW